LQTAISKLLGLKFVPLREDETVPGMFGKYRAELSAKYSYLSRYLRNPSYSDKSKDAMREKVTEDIEKLKQDFIKSR